MPRSNATIDSSPVANAGHSVPDGYGAISVAAFMEKLTAAEAMTSNGFDNSVVRPHAPLFLLQLLTNPFFDLRNIWRGKLNSTKRVWRMFGLVVCPVLDVSMEGLESIS